MKDSYSLDRDQAGLERQYRAHYEAYRRIGQRTGVPLTAVRSDTGMMGGAVAHEFMYLTPAGEDSLALCAQCGYAANRDVAEFALEPAAGEPEPLAEVHTPGTATIDDLAAYLGIAPRQTAKMVFYAAAAADAAGAPEESATVVAAIVRGDLEANLIQVQHLAGVGELRSAHEDEIAATGMVPGFASPVGIDAGAAIFVVDRWVAESRNLVMGANRADYHLRNVCCGRDYQATVVGPVAAAFDGAPCASCGSPLKLARGVEVGNIFQLGTRYAEALEARFTDEAGAAHPVVMGSYGIGLERLLACVAEEHRDEHGPAAAGVGSPLPGGPGRPGPHGGNLAGGRARVRRPGGRRHRGAVRRPPRPERRRQVQRRRPARPAATGGARRALPGRRRRRIVPPRPARPPHRPAGRIARDAARKNCRANAHPSPCHSVPERWSA